MRLGVIVSFALGCGRTELWGADGIQLSATRDDARSIHLAWTAPARGAATGYLVRRDGIDLATVAAEPRRYDDLTVGAAAVVAPTVTATQGTRTDAVGLTWSAAAVAGASHDYQVIAIEGTSLTLSSNVARGAWVAPPIAGYQIRRDDGAWRDVGAGRSFDDPDAPLGTIAADAEAVPRYPGGYVHLRVIAAPAITPPAASAYRVRARTSSGGFGPESPPATGYRGVGQEVTYQWQRSAADADAAYADLAGVTGSVWFDPTAPPEGRYFRAAMRADGAAGVTRGVRATILLFKDVSAGADHSCGLLTDDTAVCWGDNSYGQAPPSPSADTFKTLSAGGWHTCGIHFDGTIRCWGLDNFGQVSGAPAAESFESVSASYTSACALTSSHRLVCWGGAPPIVVPAALSDMRFKSISASCAVRDDDKLVCWGSNAFGEAPPGPSVDSFKSVSTGGGFTCAIRADDQVVCSGYTPFGYAPAVPPPDSFKSVSAGEIHACGIRWDDRIACWGIDFDGRAPPGPSEDRWTRVSAFRDHTCGLRFDGHVLCWGGDLHAEAPPAPSNDRFASVSLGCEFWCGMRLDGSFVCAGGIEPMHDAAMSLESVAAGTAHACGIRADGHVVCWGDPFFDQAAFAGPTDGAFSSISAASELTCGVRSDGRIVCWGFLLPYIDPPESTTDWFESASVGSEGFYSTVCGVRRGDRAVVCWGRSPPFSYSGSSNLAGSFSSVSVGNAFACGVRLDGHVVCVGYYNHGRGPTEPSADVFKSVSAGVDYACGLRADDRIVCWGDNSVGQAPPTPSLDRFKSVSAGAGSTCAVRLDDRILCWGGGGLGL